MSPFSCGSFSDPTDGSICWVQFYRYHVKTDTDFRLQRVIKHIKMYNVPVYDIYINILSCHIPIDHMYCAGQCTEGKGCLTENGQHLMIAYSFEHGMDI
jgi:hypothetical protein